MWVAGNYSAIDDLRKLSSFALSPVDVVSWNVCWEAAGGSDFATDNCWFPTDRPFSFTNQSSDVHLLQLPPSRCAHMLPTCHELFRDLPAVALGRGPQT